MLKYDTIIQDHSDKGVIEKADLSMVDGIKHYIPHHVVISPQKATSKLKKCMTHQLKLSVEAKR